MFSLVITLGIGVGSKFDDGKYTKQKAAQDYYQQKDWNEADNCLLV